MSESFSDDLSALSMFELFRVEVENQARVLTQELLAMEQGRGSLGSVEALMRAAHSLKGAARIVGVNVAVEVAHVMEDCFSVALERKILLEKPAINAALGAVDLLVRVAKTREADLELWSTDRQGEVHQVLEQLAGGMGMTQAQAEVGPKELGLSNFSPVSESGVALEKKPGSSKDKEGADHFLRVSPENLNRLLGLAGEVLVQSRWPRPYLEQLLRLKRMQTAVLTSLEQLKESLGESSGTSQAHLLEIQKQVSEARHLLMDRVSELEQFDRHVYNLSHRLYQEVLDCRMRPFADGVHGFPRMVRDMATVLGKEMQLDLVGQDTSIDREMLEQMEAPLTHLLRNAVDHGIESVEERSRQGKPRQGVIRLEARHSAGMLVISVSDDGRGISVDGLRRVLVEKRLATPDVAASMNESEVLDFLFLPGFTLKATVTELSGRGFGLDIVRTCVQRMRGSLRVQTQAGQGMRFQMHLPLTLSVLRSLLVEVAGEPYAFPLAYLQRTCLIQRAQLETLEGRQFFRWQGRNIGVVTARQVLELDAAPEHLEEVAVVVVGEGNQQYGVIVDRFLGQKELVVQPLDSRLGKLKNIQAGAVMEDGRPVLILDHEDFLRSIDKLVTGGKLAQISWAGASERSTARQRILVVDDSLTVRELQRKLLLRHGYEVDVAVDGMDGWNTVRNKAYALVITDVDMPRMDGIELVKLIKRTAHLKGMPVMIVSYKDRPEDRQRGLEAGADYYLAKGSFHDETLVQAVVDLIGKVASA